PNGRSTAPPSSLPPPPSGSGTWGGRSSDRCRRGRWRRSPPSDGGIGLPLGRLRRCRALSRYDGADIDDAVRLRRRSPCTDYVPTVVADHVTNPPYKV